MNYYETALKFPINLDKNENNFGPAPICKEVMTNLKMEHFTEYARDNAKNIRHALSRRFGVKEESILTGYGAVDVLINSLNYLMQRGNTILLPYESWWYFDKIISVRGGDILYYYLKTQEGNYYYDVNSILEIAIRHDPKFLLICSPNNPTGTSLPLADLEKILRTLPETIIILDEAYWGFSKDNPSYEARFIERYPQLIIVRTFSKLYAMAGIRIGFAFVGDNYKRLLEKNERYLGYNRISEELAVAALESFDYYSHIANLFIEERDKFYSFFSKYPELTTCYKSESNFILVKLQPDFFKRLQPHLIKKQVIIKFFTEEKFKDQVRITIGTPPQNEYLRQSIQEVI
ncbi:MAG: aminotransferase class I/II-fold pyridoxal phosphate-dependent enzyme [Candidatus Coatesbacteria bacterium]|nr:aminotransferase class I/II-fold pyridoxal phosphate-dependent enzyme [Candidatus Coatesbacteria bacterium]